MTDVHLGVDLGATNLRVLVGDADGVRGHHRTATPGDGTVAAAVRAGIRTACDRAGCDPAEIGGAGIATVGPLEDGRLRDPVNLARADGLDLRSVVAGVVESADPALVNDATAAAVAEAETADTDHIVYLTLSTGVGAGVVADGQPLVGCQGNAGEVGHVTLAPDSELACGCGGLGHWEALCGGANLPAHARAVAAEGVETELARLDPEALLSTAGSDPLSTALVERLGRYNARGAGFLVSAYDPARVVVGGGLAINHPETLLEPIRDRLPAHCLRAPPPVEVSRHGDEAAARGALALARRRDRNR